MKITIQDISEKDFCRLAFAQHLFEAGTVGGEGKPAFSCTALIPPGHPAVAAIEAAEVQVATEKWGAKGEATLKSIRAAGKGAIKDGDTKADYDGFEGNRFVSTRADKRPGVYDRDKSVLVAADGRPYSGCYANVMVEIWAQDNSYGKRINAQLLGVQFSRDGDSFGGGAQAAKADDFPDLDASEQSSALDD
jgi:hypothetical protein